MSDTQAAMREFRFLDDKRKTNGLTDAEEERWQELGASLGMETAAPPPQGYYGPDGQWYQYPPGYDPATGQYAAYPGYQQPYPYPYPPPQFDPATGQYYAPQPQFDPATGQYAYPGYQPPYPYPYPQPQFDPATGQYYAPQPQYDPVTGQYYAQPWPEQEPQAQGQEPDPSQAQPWAGQWQSPPGADAPLPPTDLDPQTDPHAGVTADPAAVAEPVVEEAAPPPEVDYSLPEPVPALGPHDPEALEVSSDEVMEVRDDEVSPIPTAPSPSAPSKKPAPLPISLQPEPAPEDPLSEMRNSLALDKDLGAGSEEPLIRPSAPRPSLQSSRSPPPLNVTTPEPKLGGRPLTDFAKTVVLEPPAHKTPPSPPPQRPPSPPPAPKPPAEPMSIRDFTKTVIIERDSPAPQLKPPPPVEPKPPPPAQEPRPLIRLVPPPEVELDLSSEEVEPEPTRPGPPVPEADEPELPMSTLTPEPQTLDNLMPPDRPRIQTPREFPSVGSASIPIDLRGDEDTDPGRSRVDEPSVIVDDLPTVVVDGAPSRTTDVVPVYRTTTPTQTFAISAPPEPLASPPAPEPELPPAAVEEPPPPLGVNEIEAEPTITMNKPELPAAVEIAEAPAATVTPAPQPEPEPEPEPAPVAAAPAEPEPPAAPVVPEPPTASHTPSLLDSIAIAPDMPVTMVPPTTEAEQQQLADPKTDIAYRMPAAHWVPPEDEALDGHADDKIELAGPAEFVSSSPSSEGAVDVPPEDETPFEVDSSPLAAVATNMTGTGPAEEGIEEKLELAQNADFLAHPQVTQTGAAWQRSSDSGLIIDAEVEGEIIQGTVVEEEAPAAPAQTSPSGLRQDPLRPLSQSGLRPVGTSASPSSVQAAPAGLSPFDTSVAPSLPRVSSPQLQPATLQPAAPPQPIRGLQPTPIHVPPPEPVRVAVPTATQPPQPSNLPQPPAPSMLTPVTGPAGYPHATARREDLFAQEGLQPAPAAAVERGPIRITGEHRVILHTMEGQVKRGALREADLASDGIALENTSGANETIPQARVKAIFFMLAPGTRAPIAEGQKVRVTFKDGRQVAGFSQDHASGGAGFFVVPADNRTNTERIFIFRHAIQAVLVEA